jgi:flagellar motility protein MotE (MotC chaperone)
MTNNIKSNPDVESYRLGQIEKAFEKFTERIEKKLDDMAKTFATNNALDNAVVERNQRIAELDERMDAIEKKKTLSQTITYVILACSLIVNLIAVYELFK